MADELRYTAVSCYTDDDVDLPNIGIVDSTFDVVLASSTKVIGGIISVGTSEEAIPLGEVTAAGGHMTVVNLDDSNYIELRDATGASNDVIKVPAGECAMFRWGSDVTAPYWIANTAAVRVNYRLVSA